MLLEMVSSYLKRKERYSTTRMKRGDNLTYMCATVVHKSIRTVRVPTANVDSHSYTPIPSKQKAEACFHWGLGVMKYFNFHAGIRLRHQFHRPA